MSMKLQFSVLLAVLSLGACGEHGTAHSVHDHEGAHEHGHGHDEHGHDEHGHGDEPAHADHEDAQGHHDHNHGSVLSITEWTDTLELFAEYPTAVVDHELSFLAHLTILEGFEALTDAHVRLVLEGPLSSEQAQPSEQAQRLTAEADMLRPGIYAPSLTPTVAGTYRGSFEVLDSDLGTIGGFDIVVYADEHDIPAEGEEEEGHSHAVEIPLLKEQQWRVPFSTAFATRGEIAPSITVAGELGAPPSGRAHVHSPVAGRVMPGREAFPAPGQRVEAGQELATLAPTPGSPEGAAAAASSVVSAQAELENASAAAERAERMLADHAIPERQLSEANRRLRVAQAALSATRRAQALYSTAQRGRGRGTWSVSAPIGGVIEEVEVSPGEAVDANELLFRINDPAQRWLTAFVPEAWIVGARPEGRVSFQLSGEERWRPLRGSLVNVSSAVDERTRTVRVIWALTEPAPELRVGAATRVTIPRGVEEAGILLPSSALVDVQGRQVAYVQVEGEAFEERAIRVGASNGAQVLALEGIEAGERVVTRGGYLVRLASTAGQSSGHGHGHPH